MGAATVGTSHKTVSAACDQLQGRLPRHKPGERDKSGVGDNFALVLHCVCGACCGILTLVLLASPSPRERSTSVPLDLLVHRFKLTIIVGFHILLQAVIKPAPAIPWSTIIKTFFCYFRNAACLLTPQAGGVEIRIGGSRFNDGEGQRQIACQG